MSKKNLFELWRDKELPGDWNERIGNPHNYEGEELAFYSGFMVHANIDQIQQENGNFDKWEDVETLESNRLYMADYECEGDRKKNNRLLHRKGQNVLWFGFLFV